jgi:S-(hydroxymethyl)glutathione dehydrogenase/alcohol dehydrogenase
MKTRAAVSRELGEPFTIEELELAPPKANEVLVKTAHTGWCHSDLSQMKGSYGMDLIPYVPGHEVAGVVQEVGAGVTSLKPGDRVVSCWVAPCGKCEKCVSGQTHICETLHPGLASGKLLDGTSRFKAADGEDVNHFLFSSGFSEYIVTPEISSVKVPDELPLDQACLLGCCVCTGWGAVHRTSGIIPGQSAAVWGMGGIGLNIIQGLKTAGAYPIIAVDLEGSKEEIARKMGATHFINSSKVDPIPVIREELTAERGLDFVFEAIGDPGAYTQAFFALAIGGTMVGVGVPSNEDMVSLPFFMIPFGSMSIKGCIYGGVRHSIEIPLLANMAVRGDLDLKSLINKKFKLDEINEVAQAMEERKIVGRWVCDF